MKQLILGSSGQIGMALSTYYKARGDEVLNFDIENDFREDLRVAESNLLRERMQQADFVHFLAFDVGGSRYLKTYQHTQEFLSNNVRLMEATFSVLKETGKPFIFASSQMSNMSYSPYGVLKALGEAYTRSLNGLVVKFWNVYGIEHDQNKSHVITDFIMSARNKKRIDMMTNGTEVRQFLHANDCSECLDILSRRYLEVPRDMNLHITSFKWHSILEIATLIADLYPSTKVFPAELVDEVQRDARNEPDISVLSFWQPKIGLAEGITLVNQGL
jgi:nucleoside-diphosphate-sugar epimerase